MSDDANDTSTEPSGTDEEGAPIQTVEVVATRLPNWGRIALAVAAAWALWQVLNSDEGADVE